MNGYLDLLAVTGAVGTGLVGGIFFAFSTFIMRALDRIPPEQGIAAMQAINVTVLNPWFFSAFFGTGLICIATGFLAWGNASGSYRACLLAGCALYLAGTILVTVAANVPWNDQLAAAGTGADAVELWARYLSVWTWWNHVRTAASLAACGLFAIALWIRH